MTASSTGQMQNLRGTDNTALIPKYWEKKYLKDQFEKDPLKPFYGTDSVVVTDYDLKAKKGDIVIVTIVGLPTGAGVTDDGDYDADIGSMEVYDFAVQVHEHGRALGLKGKMSEKSPSFNSRTVLMDGLTQWRSMFNARAVIDALSGMQLHQFSGAVLGASALASAGGGVIATVNQVIPAYASGDTSKRYYCGGQTSAGSNTGRIATIAVPTSATDVNYLMGPLVIEDLRRMARGSIDRLTGEVYNPMQPINVNGKMLFILLVSLEQGKNIRGSNGWKNGHYYADIRGMENSIFSGQIGVWDGVMIIETDLVHQRRGTVIAASLGGPEWMDISTTNLQTGVAVHRALFLGKKAVAWAWGEAPQYKEFYADHAKTKWASRVTSIYGVRKIVKSSSTTGTSSLVTDSERGCIIADTCIV
jgi:N4-gp56 family major capsid protein